MSNHHPPRMCFAVLDWHDSEMRVRATFTEQRVIETPPLEVWDFTTANAIAYTSFKATATGAFFNANVRENATWVAVRIS